MRKSDSFQARNSIHFALFVPLRGAVVGFRATGKVALDLVTVSAIRGSCRAGEMTKTWNKIEALGVYVIEKSFQLFPPAVSSRLNGFRKAQESGFSGRFSTKLDGFTETMDQDDEMRDSRGQHGPWSTSGPGQLCVADRVSPEGYHG
ncbi:hypothetical protein RRG08_030139 [Elysia crispata]|uniref:Uncharacterized protein n=1 Tax=Elysia crispata TaxID=231223 RepID=A0AAE0ZT28_9GAST|nr:hypothetical protein RRG08_030139 [Elysia crispata]